MCMHNKLYKCDLRTHHEAYVLSNEVGTSNMNRGTTFCALWWLGRVIPSYYSWFVPFTLKCYIWFAYWNLHFLTIHITYTATRAQINITIQKNWRRSSWDKQVQWSKSILLVNTAFNPYYYPCLAVFWNCIHSCLHLCEITIPFLIDAKIGGCISVPGRNNFRWKIIISFLVLMMCMSIWDDAECRINWWY